MQKCKRRKFASPVHNVLSKNCEVLKDINICFSGKFIIFKIDKIYFMQFSTKNISHTDFNIT
jgi:hypothetical protein